jgi:beta-xylosidase
MPQRLLPLFLCLVFCTLLQALRAESPKILSWGDQGDGSFKNPIINSDYSDPDAIRVGSDYYLVTSTFTLSPGITVLHSKDMVNWQIIGHAISDLADFDKEYSPDVMKGYGRGVWAPAIRYHDGKFWVYVLDASHGLYMSTATNPAGPWTPAHQVFKRQSFDDCCPFWDDDGQMYLSCASFARNGKNADKRSSYDLYIFKLSPDGRSNQDEGTIVHVGNLCEATKLYKINGYYYLFYCENFPDCNRVQLAMRSKNIYGPYEIHRLCQSRTKQEGDCAAQGGLVQTEKGDWYYLHHWAVFSNGVGRTLALEPVHWIDGWPILGDVQPDGVGKMVLEGKKPIIGFPIIRPQTEVEFNSPQLGLQWQWNHSPRNDKWSLTERKGCLRLYASVPVQSPATKPNAALTPTSSPSPSPSTASAPSPTPKAASATPKKDRLDTPERHTFDMACNTLLQRVMGDQSGEATTCIDTSHMANGQVAGLCVVTANQGMLQIVQQNNQRSLRAYSNAKMQDAIPLTTDKVWLRFNNQKNVYQFSYSTNGEKFVPIGEKFGTGSWYHWRGVEFGLFCWNELKPEGFIDVSSFTYTYE